MQYALSHLALLDRSNFPLDASEDLSNIESNNSSLDIRDSHSEEFKTHLENMNNRG